MAGLLLLFNLQLRKKIDKPLKAGVIPVDPEEINFLEFKEAVNGVFGPFVVTLGTGHLVGPIS